MPLAEVPRFNQRDIGSILELPDMHLSGEDPAVDRLAEHRQAAASFDEPTPEDMAGRVFGFKFGDVGIANPRSVVVHRRLQVPMPGNMVVVGELSHQPVVGGGRVGRQEQLLREARLREASLQGRVHILGDFLRLVNADDAQGQPRQLRKPRRVIRGLQTAEIDPRRVRELVEFFFGPPAGEEFGWTLFVELRFELRVQGILGPAREHHLNPRMFNPVGDDFPDERGRLPTPHCAFQVDVAIRTAEERGLDGIPRPRDRPLSGRSDLRRRRRGGGPARRRHNDGQSARESTAGPSRVPWDGPTRSTSRS